MAFNGARSQTFPQDNVQYSSYSESHLSLISVSDHRISHQVYLYARNIYAFFPFSFRRIVEIIMRNLSSLSLSFEVFQKWYNYHDPHFW